MQLRTTVSISVNKPIQEVFRRFADPEFNVKVDHFTRSATRVSGEPFTKGVVWELEVDAPLVGVMKQKQTTTEFDAPYRFTVEAVQLGMSGPEVSTFEVGEGGAVEVTWDANYKLGWFLTLISPLLYPVLRRKIKTGAQSWIEDMKKAIESGEFA